MFVIQRTDQGGGFVTVSGSEKSYSPYLQDAARYPTRGKAEADRCPGNEVVLDVRGIITPAIGNGAEMATENEPLDPVRVRTIALAHQASDVLGVLRLLRDECPDEWDAMTKSKRGGSLMTLWDNLRAAEKCVLPDSPGA